MSINKRRRKKIKVRQDSYLSTSRRGTREIRPRHSLSRAQHRTAPYIYTRTHFNTSLPLPDSFPSEIFFRCSRIPLVTCLFSSHHLCFSILPVSRCFSRLPFLVESPFTASLYLSI